MRFSAIYGHIYRCTCGCCKAMSTERESVCCKEIEQMHSLLEDPDLEIRPSCVTLHSGFNSVCLCRIVLTVSLYAHRHRYEDVEIPADENR